MGCGAGAKGPPRELTDEEKQTACNVVCKEMSTICAKHAISQFQHIKIVPPNEVNQFRKNAERCREAGESLKDTLKDTAGGGHAAAAGEKIASGGFMGSMMGAVAKAADKVAEGAASGAGAAINGLLFSAAEGMDAAVDAIEKPFTEVGRDIVEAKKDKIVEIFVAYINNYEFKNAYTLVRDKGNNAISMHLTVAMVKPLANQLLPIVQEEIDKHLVTKVWDAAIEKTNAMIKMMQDNVPQLMEKYGPSEIKLDINIFIVTKVIEEIARLQGEKEIEVRKNKGCDPDGNALSGKPFLFKACFSQQQPPETLTIEHFDAKNN